MGGSERSLQEQIAERRKMALKKKIREKALAVAKKFGTRRQHKNNPNSYLWHLDFERDALTIHCELGPYQGMIKMEIKFHERIVFVYCHEGVDKLISDIESYVSADDWERVLEEAYKPIGDEAAAKVKTSEDELRKRFGL